MQARIAGELDLYQYQTLDTSEARRYASQLSLKKRAEHCGPSTLEIAVLLETAF
jgi:hypothetical protein